MEKKEYEHIGTRLPTTLVTPFRAKVEEDGIKMSAVIGALMARYTQDKEFAKEVKQFILDGVIEEIKAERADAGKVRGSYKEKWKKEAESE